jgi:hypothetical protein
MKCLIQINALVIGQAYPTWFGPYRPSSGRSLQTNTFVINIVSDGKILTEKEDIQRRWKEYFEGVLTGNPDGTDSTTFSAAENEDTQPSLRKWHT